MCRPIAGLALLVLLFPIPSAAQGIVDVVVEGNELRAGISLPGGLGADLTISFEQVVGLSAANLGLSAEVLELLDPDLLARLTQAQIPAGFPVLLRIEPPAGGGLSFSGVASISLHTHNLAFLPNTPLRIFAAHDGGRFQDITESMGMGSYRARGRKGDFSEFLILADLRPVNAVIAEKLDRIDGILDENEERIAQPALAQLTALLSQIRNAHAAGNTRRAIAKTEEFLSVVKSNSGAAIPDVWRSARDLVNVAGLLRAAGETLRFSLSLKSNLSLGLL
ncbi:MAG TPA: DUF6689 family protein [Thermoanaerobaculia bacterium]